MANRRICIQLDFNGPNPLIINSNGTFDKRTSLVNLARLIRGIDQGAQFRGASNPTRPSGPPSVIVQQSVVNATGTVTAAAVAAADTVSAAGTAMTATQLRASGTATAATVLAGTTLTINGVVFTGVAGAVVLGEATFSVDTSDTAVATSIAAQVNAYASSGKIAGVIKAKSAAAVVTLYAAAIGTAGNGYTLASSDGTTLAVSAATLANGAAAANNQFDYIGTNTETAADLVRAIGVSTSAAWKALTATSALGVVTVRSKAPGVAGNAVLWVSSNGTRLAVSGSGTLTSGSAGAPTQWTF